MSRDAVVWSGTLVGSAAGAGILFELTQDPIVQGALITIVSSLMVSHILAVLRLFRTSAEHTVLLDSIANRLASIEEELRRNGT